ncbi:MAG: hypothetical protein HYZ42_03465 [Bacteroidetes bacterium]|nr:hypothetical protein [Bacteroidota bacterium]
MPYKESSINTTPPDDTVIWRYYKFFDFLYTIRNGLWFSTLDCFDDKIEMKSPNFTEESKEFIFKYFHKGESFDQIKFDILISILKRNFYVNCWQISQCEEKLMWDSYTNKEPAILVKSTVGNLKEFFSIREESFYMETIVYDDFQSNNFNYDNFLKIVLLKHKSFSSEKELRIIISSNYNGELAPLLNPPSKKNKTVKGDYRKIITELIASPYMRDDQFRIAEEIIKNELTHNIKLAKSSYTNALTV